MIPSDLRSFAYSPEILDPVLLSGDTSRIVTERAEQIYTLPLFTRDFCRLLVETAESVGSWEVRGVLDTDHPYAPGCTSYYCREKGFPDHALMGEALPGFVPMYEEIVSRHIEPLLIKLWPVFHLQRIDPPYLAKYEPTVVSSLGDHFDLETISLVAYLNSDFKGGGTYFPRWNYSTAGLPVGSAVLFPGGISHIHRGVAITEGRRYILNAAFF